MNNPVQLQRWILGMRRRVAGAALALMPVFVLPILANSSAPAQTFTSLYSFTGGADGGNPSAPVVRDAKGNLYAAEVTTEMLKKYSK